jgi:hypothetical protein
MFTDLHSRDPADKDTKVVPQQKRTWRAGLILRTSPGPDWPNQRESTRPVRTGNVPIDRLVGLLGGRST